MELQPGVKPCFARKPRKTPLHWAENVKKEFKKLMKASIIENAGFVAKDEKEEKLRLICNIRNLNKGVKSDCSIFPNPNKVMQSLSSASKYFIKSDMLQGYH